MAVKYYKEAAEFKKALQDAGITQLTPNNAENVEDVIDENGEVIYSFMNGPNADKAIFDFGDGIEEPQSNFNEHRLAVIRYVIESNLATALANYNNGGYQFTMPKLSEEDWATIMNNVSLISFLQGLSIGGKVYNGYSVINNNKNEEVVTENSIYLIEDVNNPNRASGTIRRVYTEKMEDARQTALDIFKQNSYSHNVTFKMMDKYIKIGTPIAIKTKENTILDTYISAIKFTKSNFIEYTCGNIRIKFIDKLLKERSN